ncbi:uncharacterized protein cep126 [Dunckerocampus dactyliophorus]|uniref:uncharacterized protein cep126 n=1 Tax=Dunckerocampus dactyliophorus TaxID=161453 RepID=UPI002406A340|nr:uncharacterized protein cep126 [Dunckerocampus dactyliophorus]XP_054649337.1 uncharacterized protein cep126 [Dunckerocampus dactyliophorus]
MSDLQQEREALVEEQKVSRERARRCVQETNRRRRDLREKQRQWVLQEQKRREEVLQQRRQKFQAVTENFQRAYVPPSLRQAQCLARNGTRLEDALQQVRGSGLPCNISSQTSSAPTSKPPVMSASPPRQSPAAQREQSICVQRWQEPQEKPQEPQEKQQEHSGQDDNVSCCSKSSLSSRDSLENEEPTESAIVCYTEMPPPDLKCPNDACLPLIFKPVMTPVSKFPGDVNYNVPIHKETRASINNLNKFSTDMAGVWKHINTALAGSPKWHQSPQNGGEETSGSKVTSLRLTKGILKGLSGETPTDSPCSHASCGKAVELLVRDSIEVAKARAKSTECKSAAKKLRWLDEEDPRPRPTDAHVQAWADVGVQVSLATPQGSTCMGGPHIPRRDHSAGVGAGLVSSLTVKEFVAQPRSATVTPVVRTMGETYKHEGPMRGLYSGDQARVNHRSPEEVLRKERHVTGDGGVTTTRLPPSCWRATPVFCQQGGGRGQGAVYREKALDCTPTDEIYQLCQDVRSAFISSAAATRCQAGTSGRGVNKSCVDQIRQTPASNNKKTPESFKAANPGGPHTKEWHMDVPNKGVRTTTQRCPADTYTYAASEDRGTLAATGTSKTQRMQQQQRRLPPPTSISMEEQSICQSLDRLNYQLHRKDGLH